MREIHYSSICPFSRTVILLAGELKLDFQLIEEKNLINIVNGYNNCNNYLPFLIDNELKINSAYAICEYLIENYGTSYDYLLGKTSVARAKTREIIDWASLDFFTNTTKVIIYEKILKNYELNRKDRSPDSNLIRLAELKLKHCLMKIQLLLGHHEFCSDEKISLTDFVIAANISVLDYMGHISWTIELKRLKHWYLILKSRPNFRNLLNMKMQGFQPSLQYASVDF